MQGQSRATIDKERRIGSALTVCMRIAANKFGGKGYSYWHADLNAGSGHNEIINVPGSPLVFYELAHEYLSSLPPEIFFAERRRETAVQLLKHCQASEWQGKTYIFPHDNEEVLEVFAECIRQRERPRFAIGTILIDPNGWFYRNRAGEGPPVDGLLKFVHEFPRIDVVANLNVRTFKLQRAQGHRVPDLTELLMSLNKQYWLISRAQYGGDRFIQLIGRNVETGPHKALGIHRVDSPEGREISEWMNGNRQGYLL